MGWSVDSLLFETGKCSVEAENIGKMWNFFKKYARLVQFPRSFSPHDFGKILTFQSGKLEKELCATNPSNRNFQNLCLTSTDILDIPDYLLLCLPAPMRLWRMVCALCRELRRLWHEATEATHFFDEFSLRLLFFRFRFEPHPTPFFCHVFVCVFFFFSESLLTSEVKTDENLGVFFSFFVDADAKTWGIPQDNREGKHMLACLCHKYPHFFWKGSFAMKKTHQSTENSKCSSFFIEKCWFFLFDFFGGWKVAPVNQRAMDRSSQDILWEEMVFWGKKSPDAGSILQETSGKIPHPFIGFLNPSPGNGERWPNTKQTKKKQMPSESDVTWAMNKNPSCLGYIWGFLLHSSMRILIL